MKAKALSKKEKPFVAGSLGTVKFYEGSYEINNNALLNHQETSYQDSSQVSCTQVKGKIQLKFKSAKNMNINGRNEIIRYKYDVNNFHQSIHSFTVTGYVCVTLYISAV